MAKGAGRPKRPPKGAGKSKAPKSVKSQQPEAATKKKSKAMAPKMKAFSMKNLKKKIRSGDYSARRTSTMSHMRAGV